jgi:hypothetical protein
LDNLDHFAGREDHDASISSQRVTSTNINEEGILSMKIHEVISCHFFTFHFSLGHIPRFVGWHTLHFESAMVAGAQSESGKKASKPSGDPWNFAIFLAGDDHVSG